MRTVYDVLSGLQNNRRKNRGMPMSPDTETAIPCELRAFMWF